MTMRTGAPGEARRAGRAGSRRMSASAPRWAAMAAGPRRRRRSETTLGWGLTLRTLAARRPEGAAMEHDPVAPPQPAPVAQPVSGGGGGRPPPAAALGRIAPGR